VGHQFPIQGRRRCGGTLVCVPTLAWIGNTRLAETHRVTVLMQESAAVAAMVRLLETDHLNDQFAALALRKQAFVLPDLVAVAGNSFGGIETVMKVYDGAPRPSVIL
jgi:hypothetical protein